MPCCSTPTPIGDKVLASDHRIGAACYPAPSMFSRRNFIVVAALSLPCVLHAGPRRLSKLPAALAHLEENNGGRLGVAVLDTSTGERSGYRADERFPMCSTFKFLLASAFLQRVDHHRETPLRFLRSRCCSILR
jgi:beta-lactamase class A